MPNKKNKYKTLIHSELFHKDGSPHLAVTVIAESIKDRHSVYDDIAGILENANEDSHDHIIDYMSKLVNKFNQNLIYILQGEHALRGWLFYKENDEILSRKINIDSSNNINYNIWIEISSSPWNPVDFLLDGDYFDSSAESPLMEEIRETLEGINDKLSILCERKR